MAQSLRESTSAMVPAEARLPSFMAVPELLVSHFRRYLAGKGVGSEWEIFCGDSLPAFARIVKYVDDLGEENAEWDSNVALCKGGGQPIEIGEYKLPDYVQTLRPGYLLLPAHECAIGSFQTYDMFRGAWRAVFLFAAPSSKHYLKLISELRELKIRHGGSRWEVVGTEVWKEGMSVPRRQVEMQDLVLSGTIRSRLQEATRFLTDPQVLQIYRQLGCPPKRGYLLYGPPGCGKSSAIHALAHENRHMPALLLRPSSSFGNSDLADVFRHLWNHPKAMLVVEDIDALFGGSRCEVSLSSFLNLLDGGPEQSCESENSWLIIATTNHPDRLDFALSNRPGRFDALLEFPLPDEGGRLEFLEARVPDLAPEALEEVAKQTRDLSFSHLQECVVLAGLYAIEDGRLQREVSDLNRAVQAVVDQDRNAVDGFKGRADPFGFCSLEEGAGDGPRPKPAVASNWFRDVMERKEDKNVDATKFG